MRCQRRRTTGKRAEFDKARLNYHVRDRQVNIYALQIMDLKLALITQIAINNEYVWLAG